MNRDHKVAARTFLARMNEGRKRWLSRDELINACDQFFVINGYSVEKQKTFADNHSNFEYPIVGIRTIHQSEETLAGYIHPRLDKYEIELFGHLESALFSILDNVENANLMLVTDSLSYSYVMNNLELNVAVENLMGAGLYLLFLNDRSGHALFDNFKSLSAPIPTEY